MEAARSFLVAVATAPGWGCGRVRPGSTQAAAGYRTSAVPGARRSAPITHSTLELTVPRGARTASIFASMPGFSAVNSCRAAASRLPITGHRYVESRSASRDIPRSSGSRHALAGSITITCVSGRCSRPRLPGRGGHSTPAVAGRHTSGAPSARSRATPLTWSGAAHARSGGVTISSTGTSSLDGRAMSRSARATHDAGTARATRSNWPSESSPPAPAHDSRLSPSASGRSGLGSPRSGGRQLAGRTGIATDR